MTVSKRVLKEVRDLTVANNSVILADIQKHVLRQSLEPDEDRRSDVLHPSDMSKSDWCWRADYYRIQGVPLEEKSLNPSFRMENVFEEGHEIHRKWQRWLWDLGYLYGVFYCSWCDNEWWDRSPRECFYCGRARFLHYREVPLEAPHLHIQGKSDGGIWIDGEPFRLLEIKSLSIGTLRFEAPDLYDRYQNNESLDKIWMEIKRPFPTHLRQGAMYLYMATRGSPQVPIPSEIVFIYEWKPAQQVKEFVVKYTARMVEHMLFGAQQVTDALENDRPPQRPRWAHDEDTKICRSCSYRSVCWKLDAKREEDPPTITVKRAAAGVRRKALGVRRGTTARKAG